MSIFMDICDAVKPTGDGRYSKLFSEYENNIADARHMEIRDDADDLEAAHACLTTLVFARRMGSLNVELTDYDKSDEAFDDLKNCCEKFFTC